ncbi:unnamed protein product [Durusdinium trenchii]|uniref:Uncharacterized protein n=2 Tax=Durusdinium trenchii TaxID=1381693 RepID=A0ABP0SCR4_9DINO
MRQHGAAIPRPVREARPRGLSGTMQENEMPPSKKAAGEANPAQSQPNPALKWRDTRRVGLGFSDPSSSSLGRSGRAGLALGFGTPPGRKRPAEACFVDDEFRTPEREQTRSSPAAAPDESITVTPPRRRYRARESPSSDSRALANSEDSSKENKRPDDELEATPEPMARVLRSSSWTPGRRTLELGNVLQELALTVPEELLHQGQTPESPHSEGSPHQDVQSQNVAELDEQMARNERHNFEIYIDPENR